MSKEIRERIANLMFISYFGFLIEYLTVLSNLNYLTFGMV